MKIQRKLTPEEFEAIKPRLKRMSQRNVDAAYQVLVNDKTQSEIARELGVTQQSIGDAVNAVWKHFQKHYEQESGLAIPSDWIKVSALLPPEMAKVVTQMEKSARDKLRKDQR
ncbi:hypothetical protein BVER_00865c [Candidatus Burkholderia verschuerenii]|uniref:TrfB transcriptional repressor protein domain-containing protein n=1 Tax=Candidatus Burkholderia verschuerenii TaxID=242163 RepID=A0A0L0ME49_9BURK|nr:TrfB-related DNA-binding protein [Candidatus Burkholderia verschuerenii]KND60982.1 hypothetical protein BVER_00865c [Candidatus Burkholderia verschuerenii]